MSIDQTLGISLIRGGQNALSQTVLASEEGEANRDLSVGVVTNQSLGLALTIANIRQLVILADKDCTLKTNSSGAPQETITLKAGVPFVWHSDMPLVTISEIFAGNITDVFLTTTVATRLQWFTVLNVP